jgi:GNAT superfamily N-acetyltransferase
VQTVFTAQVPDAKDDWQIGCIVGPSGSGKTSIAREAFGRSLFTAPAWPRHKAIVDCFGDIEVRKITGTLTAVGFSSPPAWIRPFATLSNGEQFRANLARALLSPGELVAYDEFTSVVDRTVARVGSAAVAKSIRKGIVGKKFVAVTCHYDILPWLSPDWVLDASDWTLTRHGEKSRRLLQRPKIKLEICRCLPDAWVLFKRHHYLSSEMSTRGPRCFLGIVNGQAIAFACILPCPGLTGGSRVSRVVVLPDWQGIGIGRAFCRGLGGLYQEQGRTLYLRTSHAMMIRSLAGDKHWAISGVKKYGSERPTGKLAVGQTRKNGFVEFLRLGKLIRRKVATEIKGHQVSTRPGVSFVYVGQTAAESTRPGPRRSSDACSATRPGRPRPSKTPAGG